MIEKAGLNVGSFARESGMTVFCYRGTGQAYD